MDIHSLVVEILVSGGFIAHSVVLVPFVLQLYHHSHLQVRAYTLVSFLTVIATCLPSILDYIPLDLMVSYSSLIYIYMLFYAVPLSLPSTVTPTISNLTYYHRTLTCESAGSPATSVSWMKDGGLLTTDGPTGYTLTQTVTDRPSSTYSNVLTVSETATGGVAGTYTCIVANNLGSHAREIVAIGN